MFQIQLSVLVARIILKEWIFFLIAFWVTVRMMVHFFDLVLCNVLADYSVRSAGVVIDQLHWFDGLAAMGSRVLHLML